MELNITKILIITLISNITKILIIILILLIQTLILIILLTLILIILLMLIFNIRAKSYCQTGKRLHLLSERLKPLKPLNTIMLWWSEGFQDGSSIGSPWCLEMPVSRTTVRLIAVVFRIFSTNICIHEIICKNNIEKLETKSIGKVELQSEYDLIQCTSRLRLKLKFETVEILKL